MKTNCWLVLGTILATTAVAQVNTNKLPEIPAPVIGTPAATGPVVATNAAPKKSAPVKHKKKAVAKPAAAAAKIIEVPVTLVAGTATVNAENVNFRGQAGLKGEALGHLKKGGIVTVIAQINLDKHAAGEPAQWAKILLPSDTKVWIYSKYVDLTNKVVSVKKLNLRAGPGENYSVLGVLEKGAPVSEISAKGDWTQIEAPTNAFAFVAAIYLKQEAAPAVEPAAPAPAPVETPVVATPPPTTNTVAEAQPIVTQPVVTQPVPPVADNSPAVAVATNVPVVVDTNSVPPVVDTNPPPPRVVTHEGFVRPSTSIVAPTYYELYDADSDNAIDYLYTTTTNLNLSRYNGFQIVVTGEEGLTARWGATPVLTVQKIYVLSTNNQPSSNKRVTSPRASQRH